MDYVTLAHTDLRVSRCCLGTMTFGEQNTEAQGHAQLDRAAAAGVNFVDTAEMYPVPARAATQGRTEEIVGSWLAQGPRDRVVLATKAAGPNRSMDWIRGGPLFTRDQLRRACEDSLKRLKTDYIDLYQLHWPARNVPMFGEEMYNLQRERGQGLDLEDTLRGLEDLVQAGKVTHVGISNETPWGVMRFSELHRWKNLPRMATIQNPFNLLNRGFETSLLEVCHREEISLLAYSPLGFGILSGKYLKKSGAGRMTLFPGFGSRYNRPLIPEAVKAYAQLAKLHGLTAAQLALAWVKSRPYVASTIIGATTLEQLEENLGAFNLNLSQDVLQGIDEIHRRTKNPAS